jgi:hypothetical protein
LTRTAVREEAPVRLLTSSAAWRLRNPAEIIDEQKAYGTLLEHNQNVPYLVDVSSDEISALGFSGHLG